jgi:hypothetical protein
MRMANSVNEYFRCYPENFIQLELEGSLSADSGYFRFGPETICYGTSSSGFKSRHVTGPLHDILGDVKADQDGAVRLSLDPNEIVENLRNERYELRGGKGLSRLAESGLSQTVYYLLRPLLPVSIRKYLQRRRLSDWQSLAFPRWPTDRTVEEIHERLLLLSLKAKGLQRVPFVWFWPNGARSCAIMTHDVEELAGLNFCSPLMDLDEAAGIRSSFQIVPEVRYPVPGTLLDEIRTRGFELNIHDLNHDGRLYSSRAEFRRRIQRIHQHAREYGALGFRSGVLHRNQAWYDDLEFSYDMSIPNVAHLDPQRGGCCSLMPFFIGKVLELPVTMIQDYSLFHILNDYSIGIWTRQLNAITENHGLANFIVHPDYIIERRARAVYQALLEHLAEVREERKIWIALPREVDRWWRERSQMKIVSDGSGWQIVGEGRERARVAFASVAGDRLVFTVGDDSVATECSAYAPTA